MRKPKDILDEKDSELFTRWYPCAEGTMPEDIIGYETWYDGNQNTTEVIVAYSWANGFWHGKCITASRQRHKGNKLWKWDLPKSWNFKPLWWMPYPEYSKLTDEEYERFFNIKFIKDDKCNTKSK